MKIPAVINNDYTIPKFVGENTLVIVSSFSGNTEETLEALKVAQESKAEIACITNGGKLAEIAKENNYNLLILPKAFSPRAMLTYSVIQQLFLFNHYGFINKDYIKETKETVTLLNNEVEDIISTAKKTAIALQNKTFVTYSESSLEGVIIRFKQQINENSKALGWAHVFPEMNHNESVAWGGVGADQDASAVDHVLLLLTWQGMHRQVSKRMDWMVAHATTDFAWKIAGEGNTLLESMLHLCILMDWISIALALLHGKDPAAIGPILALKAHLESVQ